MINKIINKDKIIKELNKRNALQLVNSRNDIIATMMYDSAYTIDDDNHSTIRFSLDDSQLEYFLRIEINNILMYDKEEHQLYIKVM